jgi:SNF2 family DNA or RNA helicase
MSPWPELKYFSTQPCARHAPHRVSPVLCTDCGFELRKHQRVGAAWCYYAGQGLDGDTVGSGKTATILAVLAMCKEHGELGYHNRAVVICQAVAVEQWATEVRRLLPDLDVFAASGDKESRIAGWLGKWEIAIVSDRTFSPASGRKIQRDGDVALAMQQDVGIVVYDDLDAMRNHTTATYWAVNRIAARASRVIGVHGTALQKRLTELWCALAPVGGRERLGTLSRVKARYTGTRKRIVLIPDPNDPTGRKAYRKQVIEEHGLTDRRDRIAEFQRAIAPLVLRRTAKDLDDVQLPAIQYNPVWIELSRGQRRRYEELRRGVLRRIRDGVETVSYTEAAAAFTRGWQICSGLAALDGPGGDDSAKFDWVTDKLTGDLAGEKAVCFVYHRDNVRALSARLTRLGIKHVLMWSEETSKKVRDARVRAFRTDPSIQVLIGTTTIERSLNLQAAAHLIAVDTVLNPKRMEQIVGRVRRDGSPFPTVFFHHLLAAGTQEEGYLPLLRAEEAMSATIWDEEAEMFVESGIGAKMLMNLVATGQAA